MASGPEHFLEAERLLEAYSAAHKKIEAAPNETNAQFEDKAMAFQFARALLEKAAVHAQLANVAAAAWPMFEQVVDEIDLDERVAAAWVRVIA